MEQPQAVWTDYTNKRYQVNILIALCMLISSVILLVYTPISVGGKFFAFYLAGYMCTFHHFIANPISASPMPDKHPILGGAMTSRGTMIRKDQSYLLL
jgi:hypothetical protein